MTDVRGGGDAPASEGLAGPRTVKVRSKQFCVGLTVEECWQLYVWLGEDAPFVRNQLSVARHGGTRDVALSTAEEHSQVSAALGRAGMGSLSEGLRALSLELG
jgi:hypothetical protein